MNQMTKCRSTAELRWLQITKGSRYAPTIILLLALAFMVACSTEAPRPTANNTPVETESASAMTTPITPAPASTPTRTPQRNLVILVAPSESDNNMAGTVQPTLTELASAEGLELEVRPSISPNDLTPEVRVVVTLPPALETTGIAELASAAPEIQFLGIGASTAQPTANLSLIRLDGSSPDQIGFLAGYLAAVITSEWRVGALFPSDDPAGTALREGFRNGVAFFCGLCQHPNFRPLITYPLYTELPASAASQEWQTAATSLIDQSVQTAYIAPGVGDADLLEMLAQAGVGLIGSQPPPAALREQWVATISVDVSSALQSTWPDLVAGQGGGDLTAALKLSDVNPELFSPGRQLLVKKLISDLQDGYIDTGVQP